MLTKICLFPNCEEKKIHYLLLLIEVYMNLIQITSNNFNQLTKIHFKKNPNTR